MIMTVDKPAEVLRWELPELTPRHKPPPSIEEIDAIEQAARAEGHAQGREEGYAAGMAEARKLAAQIEAVLDSLARPLGHLEGEVGVALGELAVRIAGELLGRAYAADPQLLAELVGRSLDLLGNERRNIEVHLHPTDIALLKPMLELPEKVRLVPDSSLARSDLRCHTDSMRIDATLQARLQAVWSTLENEDGT